MTMMRSERRAGVAGPKFNYLMILHCDAGHLTFPLAYPHPDGEFYGYVRWGILEEEKREGLLIQELTMHENCDARILPGPL